MARAPNLPQTEKPCPAPPRFALQQISARRNGSARKDVSRGNAPRCARSPWASPPPPLACARSGLPSPRNLDRVPFHGLAPSPRKRRRCKAARPPFRNGSLASHRGSRETLLHVGPQGSHSCCRYFHQDLHQGRVHHASQRGFGPTPAPSYSWPCLVRGPGRRMRGPLQRHPFSGLQSSAGELLHTPWRVPTSMATVLLS